LIFGKFVFMRRRENGMIVEDLTFSITENGNE